LTAPAPDHGKLPPLLLLHPDDNILVARRDIAAGERVSIDGESVTMPAAIELGHKLARRALVPETRVFKYGAPIGSMKAAAARGEHVHLHNLRSDYLPSTSREMGTRSNTDGDGH
jgi:(2R)-sulfolactate sulfo-lyase subunit alpha